MEIANRSFVNCRSKECDSCEHYKTGKLNHEDYAWCDLEDDRAGCSNECNSYSKLDLDCALRE